ncbi:MAG: hypothetical protein IJ100_06105 [Lachnospiraceae bacterium]|jgi:hypothetical protein|nr:hypothetical protein [Lachnospiraceae bacterium]
MAVNPKQLMQMADRLRIFKEQHPRVLEFISAVGRSSLQPGVILELKVTETDGRTSVTNMRLTPEDIETIEIIKSLKGGK